MYQSAQHQRTSKQGRIQQVAAGVAAVREAVGTRLATLDGHKVAVGLGAVGLALGLAELQPAWAAISTLFDGTTTAAYPFHAL